MKYWWIVSNPDEILWRSCENLNKIFVKSWLILVKSQEIQSTSDEIRLYPVGTLPYQVFHSQWILAVTAIFDKQIRQEPIESFSGIIRVGIR